MPDPGPVFGQEKLSIILLLILILNEKRGLQKAAPFVTLLSIDSTTRFSEKQDDSCAIAKSYYMLRANPVPLRATI